MSMRWWVIFSNECRSDRGRRTSEGIKTSSHSKNVCGLTCQRDNIMGGSDMRGKGEIITVKLETVMLQAVTKQQVK